jgi:hypothetical protein
VSYGYLLRAKQTTQTTGNGDIALEAIPGGSPWQSLVDAVKFASGVGTGPWSVEVMVANATDWELLVCNLEEGSGPSGKDLLKKSTGTVVDSSNSGAAVSWGSGDKDVFGAPDPRKVGAIHDKLTTAGLVQRVSATSYSIQTVAAWLSVFLSRTTQTDARNALLAMQNVIAARGDLVVGNATPAAAVLSVGAAAKYLRSDGTDPAWATPVGSEVTHTPTSPVTATTVQAAIDQLSHAYSKTVQTTAQADFGTSLVGVSDLDNLTPPGSPNGVKIYRVSGQVTIDPAGGGGNVVISVHLGTTGTVGSDAVIATAYDYVAAGTAYLTVPIPPITCAPGSSSKISIGVTTPASGNNDVKTGTGETFCVIEQISNA